MSSVPSPGDAVPEDILRDLSGAVEEERRLWPRRLLQVALDYARRHLGMEHPTEAALWDYVQDRLGEADYWRYAQLDDFPGQFGYARRHADGGPLYIKLRFDDEFRVVVMSFHD